ncbi:hypothetical protein BIW11_12513 [Tropilaelaps mercedesae]|uniref:SWIM-type domain-containing protein n=1 Tax=Tropilaelaps mercedesae TaxID=418985 RepID=A0A1V9X6B4_9ACAR|nr:hypothetical protein BIW11_12513 [Tropilaelaps mercedesae]
MCSYAIIEGMEPVEAIVQPSVVYEIEQGPGSKPKNGRQPLPWWCDFFGPYEIVASDGVGENDIDEADTTDTAAETVVRGVGAFTLVSVFDHGGGRFMSQCLYGARAAYVKQLAKPCPVKMEHHRDGTVIIRQGIHNHGPEPEAPNPISRCMPPLPEVAPSFETIFATVQPFKRQCKREFKTYVTVLDADTQQIIQLPITTENVRKIFDSADQIKVDGKLRWCCPVDDCGSQMLGKWNLFRHLQLYHLPEGQRLHEFSSADEFWEWKTHTETVEMSTFTRHKQSKLHEIEGIYQCFLGRRAAFERKCEGEPKPRKKARLLNHFCPALMDVKLDRNNGDTRSRIVVTFYRTHIGHTPSPLDVKMTDQDSQWLREQLEAGKDPQEIMAEVARTFDGHGPLRRLHVLDLGDIARTAFRYGLRKYGCTCVSHVIDGQMCQHMHAVALRRGAPGAEFISQQQRDPEDVFNPEREIRALGRINYNQRVQEILTTLVPRMTQALQGDHFVDLEKVAHLIENAIELLEATPPVPNVHGEEDVPKPLVLNEFRSLVAKIRSAAGDSEGISEIADEGDLVSKEIQVSPGDIEKTYADLADETNYFEKLILSVSKRKAGRPTKVQNQIVTTSRAKKAGEVRAKHLAKVSLNKIKKREERRPQTVNATNEKRSIEPVVTPNRRSSRISEKRAIAAKKNMASIKRHKNATESGNLSKNLKGSTASKSKYVTAVSLCEGTTTPEKDFSCNTNETVSRIIVVPFESALTSKRLLRPKRRGAPPAETQAVHEFVITPETKCSRVVTRDPACLTKSSPVETFVVEIRAADPPIPAKAFTKASPLNPEIAEKLQHTSAAKGCIHDHIYL